MFGRSVAPSTILMMISASVYQHFGGMRVVSDSIWLMAKTATFYADLFLLVELRERERERGSDIWFYRHRF